MKQFKILIAPFLFIIIFSLFFGSAVVNAAAVFSVDTPMTLEGISNINLTIRANSEADEVSLGSTYMSVRVGIGSTFTVASPIGYTLQNSSGYDETCESNARVLTLHSASEVISTVITPVSTSTPCVDEAPPQTQNQNQGAPIIILPAILPVTPVGPATPGPAAGGSDKTGLTPKKGEKKNDPDKIVGGFLDISGLSTSDIGRILTIVNMMEKEKTYVHPSHNLFGPQSIMIAGFAAQMLTALDQKGCDSSREYPGITKCLEIAQQRGYMPDSLTIKSRMSRYLFYEALLKARNIPLDEKYSAADLRRVCKDYFGASDKVAQVYLTAKKEKLTSTYFMKKCQLDLNLSRQEAVRFVYRALKK